MAWILIITIILLLGSWIFGNRIDDKPFSEKYLKETFYSFRLLVIFYFGGIFLLYIFFSIFWFMKLTGTKFQLKVWEYLRKIPSGSVKTYSQVAKGIGKPLAVRAVANAIGKNPYAPRIPCHRVIRSDGSLGGYSGKGGIKTKKLLLKREGITF